MKKPAHNCHEQQTTPTIPNQNLPNTKEWFEVIGDIDDFIFYNQEQFISER